MRSTLDFVQFSWKELRRQQRRVLPGMIGVTAGVAILLAVIAGTDWLAVVTNRDILGQPGLAQITVTPGAALTFTNEQVQRMLSLKNVEGGYPVVTGAFPAAIGSDGTIFEMGNIPSVADRPKLVVGTWPADNEVVVPDVGMISRKTGSPLDGKALVGTSVTLSIPTEQGLGTPKITKLTVVGAYQGGQNQGIVHTVYAPLPTLVAILSAQGTWVASTESAGSAGFGTYIIDADSPHNVAAIAGQLEALGFRTQYVEQAVHGLSNRIQSIQAAAGVLVVLIVVFAAFSISNTLVQAVRQRRREIAVLLTIGFTPRWIGASLVAEAALVGLASIVMGLVIAELIIFGLGSTQPGINLHIDLNSVLVVGSGALAFCLGAAWFPTRQAMRVDPVAVLREE
jgi:ABC-type antimicrobial peptide transport system permease subunit